MLPVCDINMETLEIGKICEFVFENTKYSSSSIGTYGHWAENPYSGYAATTWYVRGNHRGVGHNTVDFADLGGVRPAIEVLKSEISY